MTRNSKVAGGSGIWGALIVSPFFLSWSHNVNQFGITTWRTLSSVPRRDSSRRSLVIYTNSRGKRRDDSRLRRPGARATAAVETLPHSLNALLRHRRIVGDEGFHYY